MEFQQFGTIETPDGTAGATLCIDSDRPLECMLQWWFEAKIPRMGLIQDKPANWARGVLALGSWSGKVLELVPQALYRDGTNGGLFLPHVLDPEELKWMKHARAELVLTDDGRLDGKWTGPDGAAGAVQLAPLPKFTRPDALRCTSWAEFKAWADKVRSDHSVEWFRGHGCNSFPLCSTLHRLGRHRLERYVAGELVKFNAHAEATLSR
jgi:hypothetical protein